MSKYTTEVRFICEQKSGLSESVGCNDVDAVIAGSWDKIFTSKVSFFDEAYRSVICSKILKHYYLREIGCETVGIWVLWMNTRLEEIMPYYNQLYKSELIKFEPLNDVHLTRKQNRIVDGTENRNGETTDTSNTTKIGSGTNGTKETGTGITTTSGTSNETKKDLYSDTPQGAITGLENENYLTNARKINDAITNSGNENTDSDRNIDGNYTENETTNNTKNGSNKVTGTSNTTEDYLETLVGKQGGGTYSKMLMEFRNTFLNIDMMIIDEFQDLFFGLW